MKKMLFFSIFLSVITIFPVLGEEAPARPLTYEECSAIALQNSNDYKARSEKQKQAALLKFKAIGNVLPSISLVHERDYSSNGPVFSDDGWKSSISATQPVFHGLEKIMAIVETDREALKEEYNLKAAERKLKEDTAGAFYSLASAQAGLINTQEAANLMSDRVKELKQREALGKSRLSELYAAQSNVALLTAQLEQARSAADAAADKLALVLGVESVSIIQPAETEDRGAGISVSFTVAGQPEIKAIEAELEAQSRRVNSRQGGFLPQVDFTVSKPIGASPYTGGGWNFTLMANWPIFEGGAKLFDTAAEYSKEEGLRQQRLSLLKNTAYGIKSRVRDYNASAGRVKALKDAYDKASKSYNLQVKDYRMGMATNIEVIQALTDMTNVKKSLDDEIINKEKNRVMLEITSEILK